MNEIFREASDHCWMEWKEAEALKVDKMNSEKDHKGVKRILWI